MLTKNRPNFFHRLTRQSVFLPDYIARSITNISIDALKTEGIKCLILDIDDTLVRRGGKTLDPKVILHLQGLRQAGIELIIGSNTNRNITSLAASIGAIVIAKKWWHYKPMGLFYQTILNATSTPTDQIAMVGDNIVNDIIGGNRADLRTILVTPFRRSPGIISSFYLAYVKRNFTN